MHGFSWIIESALAAMPVPGRTRPLADDLAFLGSQAITLLVSLTEQPPDPVAIAAAGIEQLHLPVPDFTAPTLEQLDAFVSACAGAHAQQRAVGVHCTAGLGRTGTFIAAYLASRGMTAAAAIAEVRRLRPGSVETAEQEARVAEHAARAR